VVKVGSLSHGGFTLSLLLIVLLLLDIGLDDGHGGEGGRGSLAAHHCGNGFGLSDLDFVVNHNFVNLVDIRQDDSVFLGRGGQGRVRG